MLGGLKLDVTVDIYKQQRALLADIHDLYHPYWVVTSVPSTRFHVTGDTRVHPAFVPLLNASWAALDFSREFKVAATAPEPVINAQMLKRLEALCQSRVLYKLKLFFNFQALRKMLTF